jgi:uncharacterized membrane protein YvbJ
MFCPYCGKQNPDDISFCKFCGKALPQRESTQSPIQVTPSPKKASAPKIRLSLNAVKAIVTVVLIVALVVILLQIYYPGVFPWN